jgi:hypothetical protein
MSVQYVVICVCGWVQTQGMSRAAHSIATPLDRDVTYHFESEPAKDLLHSGF